MPNLASNFRSRCETVMSRAGRKSEGCRTQVQHTPDVEELLLEYAEPSGQRCTVSVCNHLLKCLAAAFGYPYSKDKFNKSP